MTPDVYEQLRLRLLQCRAVVSLMRKWAGDEEGDDILRDGHPANTLQWAADLAVQMIGGVTDMLPDPLKLRKINYLSIITNTSGALPAAGQGRNLRGNLPS